MMRRAWAAVLASALIGCTGLPEPQPADAAWASQRWPDMSLERLKLGRQLYADKCSGCHVLKSPQSVAPEAWAGQVADMRTKMGSELSADEAELIVRYLVTAGRRGRGG
jgi:mono/diheme cytochrome c family protein